MTDYNLPKVDGGYEVILADPPWRFVTYGKNGHEKSPEAHYDTMTPADLTAMGEQVQAVAAKDCFLIMWATWPCLPQAMDLVKEWGFTYKTGGPWAKQSKTGSKWAFGTGYIFRSASEPLIVATRGKPKWHSKSERNLWVAPVREHSRKPDLIHEMIERCVPGPKLEMFARETRDNWSSWGNEVSKFDVAA